jgi:peptidyl-prolyl cis-trans isomerase B (cyclophilin B)
MKRTTAIALLASSLLGLASLTPAHAATRPTSVAGCAKSTAKGHAPATVKQPTVAAKKAAKTLTLTTNCGDIVIP